MKFLVTIFSIVILVSFGSLFALLLYVSFGNEMPALPNFYILAFIEKLGLYLTPMVFSIFVIPLAHAVMSYLSKSSGWKELSKKYSGRVEGITSKDFLVVSGRVGKIYYHRGLKLFINRSGIYLRTELRRQPWHRALFIPWHEVDSMKPMSSIGNVKESHAAIQRAIKYSGIMYKSIKLKNFPCQVIILEWPEVYENIVPSGVVREEAAA